MLLGCGWDLDWMWLRRGWDMVGMWLVHGWDVVGTWTGFDDWHQCEYNFFQYRLYLLTFSMVFEERDETYKQ